MSCSLGIALIETSSTANRWIAVNWGMGTGLFLLWIGGYGISKATGFPMNSIWIIYGQYFSILCIYFASQLVCGKNPSLCASFSILSLFLALIGMILKQYAVNLLHIGAIAALIAIFTLHKNSSSIDKRNVSSLSFNWFRFIAWAEAISLITLLFIYMPMKYWASINLDNGQGWFGWIHGVLQVMFLLSLVNLHGIAKLSLWGLVSGLGASVLPFGTIIFERNLSLSTVSYRNKKT